MSDPNVERKKSYRWASASKVSYDGADWDSSDDDAAFDPNSPVGSNHHHGTLPSLPKLDYSNDINEADVPEKDEVKEEVLEGPNADELVSRLEQPIKQENTVSPQIAIVPDFNDHSSHNSGSTSISNHNATNESNLSLKKNSPSRDINEDLDNLMKQISKEMTPQMTSNNGVFQTENATCDSINDQFLSAKGSQSPYLSHEKLVDRANSQQGSLISTGQSISDDDDSQSMDDMHVSRSGYFKAYLQSNKESQGHEEDDRHMDKSPKPNHDEENHNEDALSFTNSITYSNDDNDIDGNESRDIDGTNDAHSFAHSENSNVRSQEESDEEFKFQNKQGRESLIETSSDNEDEEASDDGIIYTNQNSSSAQSLTSGKTIEDETNKNKYNSNDHLDKADEAVPENRNDAYNFGSSESESDNDDESGLKVSKSGYFSKIINQNNQVFSRNEYENEEKPEIHYYKERDSDIPKTEDESDSLSIPGTIDDDDVRGATPRLDESEAMESNSYKSGQNQHSDDDDEDEDITSIAKSINSGTQAAATPQHEIMEPGNDSAVISLKEGSQSDEEDEDNEDNDDNEDVKTTSSWQPDTESSRSGFVQETAKKLTPPPGFVFDENGKLVDLTPSSMKPRVVSTYSEIESGWNVFPTNRGNNGINEDGADLETIHDTKTLYDNSTIYNVPGLLTNNQNLPPLPGKIDSNVVKTNNTDTDSTSAYYTPIGANTPIAGQSGNSIPTSQNSSNITVPNTKDFSRINLNNTMPELDITKLMTSNKTHNMKLRQLNEYYDNLNNYDTGLQTWVRYSLNMSRGETTSMLDYKQSKIVRDAYENAEDMSKKHTVSNTVASVNHNVSHLKKKVFQHTLKPKTLFSSIGKGVKL